MDAGVEKTLRIGFGSWLETLRLQAVADKAVLSIISNADPKMNPNEPTCLTFALAAVCTASKPLGVISRCINDLWLHGW